jgi:hypothetical protein
MRNKGWLRFSLASMTLVGASLGAFLVACGDDDNAVTPPKDGGGDTSTGTDGSTDASKDQESPADAGTNAKLQLVNAATDFGENNVAGALRVCYGLGPNAAIASLPPLPDQKSSDAQPYPGVFIGTGGAVQGTGADLTTVAITPFIMNAKTLADRQLVKPDAGDPGVSCTDILGADAGGEMIEGKDYWKLPPIPANTLLKEKSFILVLTGCTGDSKEGVAKCGPDFTNATPNGNLKVTVHEVDRATAIAADKIGTQFIHASPAGASYLANLGGGALQVIPGYMTNAADPATFKAITGDGGAGVAPAVALNEKTPLVQVSGVNAASDSFTANANREQVAMALPVIQQLSFGANVPAGGNYRNGAAFTFIAIGDPEAQPAAPTNTKRFHFIALPNDPINEKYKP